MATMNPHTAGPTARAGSGSGCGSSEDKNVMSTVFYNPIIYNSNKYLFSSSHIFLYIFIFFPLILKIQKHAHPEHSSSQRLAQHS